MTARRQQLAAAVEGALNGGIIPVLSFAASQLKLGDLPGEVSKALTKLKEAPRAKVVAALTALKDKALGALGAKRSGPDDHAFDGLLAPVIEFEADGEKHRYWIVNRGGQAVAVRASTPNEVDKAREFVQAFAGARLATDAELAKIGTLLKGNTDLAQQQITDSLITKVRGHTPAQVAEARQRIKARNKELKVEELRLVGTVVKATKTFYTKAEEDVLYRQAVDTVQGTGPFPNWSTWLRGRDSGKDTRGWTIDEARKGWHASSASRDPHAHHIVIKRGTKAQKDDTFLARSILWEANKQLANASGAAKNALNPFLGLWNLSWSPNWLADGHTNKYAEDVLNRLKEYKWGEPEEIHNVLKRIANDFDKGTIWNITLNGTGD